MDKLTGIKIKQDGEIFSDKILVGAEAENVLLSNGENVEDSINAINTTLESVHSTWDPID